MEDALQAPQLEDAIDFKVSSCFRRVETLQRMHVLPSYIGRVSEGILSTLNAQILRYSKVYGGVVLAYSKPIVLGTQGLIMDEQPHIHFSVKVSLYIFRPRVNAILRGTVNSISTAHVGCLVHNCFNASVLAQLGNHNARTTGGLFSKQLQVGRQIWFRVTRLDTTDVLFIQGEYVGMVGEQYDTMTTMTDAEESPHVIRGGSKVHAVARKASKKKKVTGEYKLEVSTQFEEGGDVQEQTEHTMGGINVDAVLDDSSHISEPNKSVKKKLKLKDNEGVMAAKQIEQLDSEVLKGDTRKRKRKVESDVPSKKRKLAS